MRSRSFIAVALLILAMLAGAAGLTAYDRTTTSTIPRGVTVAGVDVGGLRPEQARARIARSYLARLRRPVVVRHGASRFVLSPRESRVAADVDAMVAEAAARARAGNVFSRTWRRLTGAVAPVAIPARATYSEAAVVRLLDRVRAALERPARDATVRLSLAGVALTPSREGTAVLAHRLHRQLDRAVVDPGAPHALSVATRPVAPRVPAAELARRYATALVIDRARFRLRLYQGLRLAKVYRIAVGAQGRETPAGLYHVQNKTVDPAWTKPNSDWIPRDERGQVVPGGSPDNPLKARWLGIYDGAGIHGIDPSEYGTIGHAASHGCVRMRISDVIDLYDRVPVGAPIYIG